MIDDWKKSGLG